MSEPERLLRIKDVAERLGVSKNTAYLLTMTSLPRVKIGAAVRVSEGALACWIADHTEHTPA